MINGLLLKFSSSLGNRQVQQKHSIRWSNNIKPSVGGISFYILFLFSISVYGIFNSSTPDGLSIRLIGIVVSVTTAFVLGLADDAYDTIPLLKLFTQIFCGASLIITGTVIHATGIYIWDVLITLIWVVGIMNSINMLDNMDGISGTVSLCIMLGCFFALIAGQNLFSFYSVLLLGVSGAVAGFLYFNWHPAKIYMGDTGSQFLGAFISAVSIPILWSDRIPEGAIIQPAQFLIPFIAFTVPILDTTTVFIRRIARGQSPFVGGRDHISHHFAYAGLSDKKVMYVIAFMALFSAVLATSLFIFKDFFNPLLLTVGYTYMFFLFIAVQYFYDLGVRRKVRQSQLSPQANQDINPAVTSQKHSITA